MTYITWPPMPEPVALDADYNAEGRIVACGYNTGHLMQQRRACALAALEAAIRMAEDYAWLSDEGSTQRQNFRNLAASYAKLKDTL